MISFFKGLAYSNDRIQFVKTNIFNHLYQLLQYKYKVIGTKNAIYSLSNYFYLAEQAIDEYNYEGINQDDIVLDIGAAVGGFSLEIHNKVCHVYAVEPLFIDELKENINLNSAENITVLEYALGEPNTILHIKFINKSITATCKSLTELINLCGGHVDVLKTDCEGGEWNIEPHELSGIRRVEAEIHSFNREDKADFVTMLENSGFNVQVINRSKTTMLLSAERTGHKDRRLQ